MKKIMLILMLGIFLLSFAVAQEPDFSVEENQPYDIKVSCENAGGFCSGSATCNITINFPPSLGNAIMIDNQAMENLNNGFFNYSLLSNETTPIGTYSARSGCTDGNSSATTTFTYEVTPTGKILDQPQSIVVLGLILFLLILSFMSIYFGLKIQYLPFKIFLVALGILFLLVATGVTLNTIKQLMSMGSVFAGTFVNLYRLILILISAGGIGLMIYIIVMSLRQFEYKRGLKERDDDY